MRKILAVLMGTLAMAALLVSPAEAQIGKPYVAPAPAASVRIVGYADGHTDTIVDGKTVSSREKAKAAASSDYVHTPWTGYRFNSQYACVQNNIGSLWNIQYAASQYESGVRAMVLTYLRPSWGDYPCSEYFTDNQIMLVGTFQAANDVCFNVNGGAATASGRYKGHVTVAMNASAGSAQSCRSTTQRLNNNISQAIGLALGLDLFNWTSSAGSASIMNERFDYTYNWPGWQDRTSECYMLGICPD